MSTLALTDNEHNKVRAILNTHVPQSVVWAFGSRVTGTHKLWSDLDLVIVTDEPLPLATRTALENAFADSDLPFKVDIVDWAQTSEAFRQVIQKQKVVFS